MKDLFENYTTIFAHLDLGIFCNLPPQILRPSGDIHFQFLLCQYEVWSVDCCGNEFELKTLRISQQHKM